MDNSNWGTEEIKEKKEKIHKQSSTLSSWGTNVKGNYHMGYAATLKVITIVMIILGSIAFFAASGTLLDALKADYEGGMIFVLFLISIFMGFINWIVMSYLTNCPIWYKKRKAGKGAYSF